MNIDKYTIKAQEVLQKATEVAQSGGQQVIETGHLLKAVLMADENMISFLFKKIGVERAFIDNQLNEVLSGYPKVSCRIVR